MADNALNLVVKFAAIDKLTGGLKNIMTAGKQGAESVRGLQREVRAMEKDLARVNREMRSGTSANGGLIMAQRELSEAIARTNRQIETQQARIKRTARIQAGLGKVKSFGMDVGTKASLAVSLPLLAFFKTSIDQSREANIAAAQVEAGIKSMGNTAGRSLAQLRDQATALMNTSLFDDDEIMKKVTAPMLTFGKITGKTFDQAQLAAVNLSAKLGQDLQSSAIQLGKALNDPIKGITALKRVGVSFTADQIEMVKSMVAANNIAGAQALILREMNSEFGGAAMAARKADPAGAMALSFGELQQAVGDRLIPRLIPLVDKLTAVMDAFGNLSPAMQDNILLFGAAAVVLGPVLFGIAGIAAAISGVIAIAPALGVAFTVMTGPVGLFVAVIAGLAYAVYANWDKIKAAFASGVAWVKGVFAALPGWFSGIGGQIMMGLLSSLSPAVLAMRLVSIARQGVTAFKNFFGIKSPSRLMMQMGGHMASGLALGIDGGSRRPLRSMGRMAAGVAGAGALSLAGPALAGTGHARGGATAAAPITIHVHQQPGEDGQALARRVAEQLEQLQRKQRRGSFGDDF